MLQSLGNMPEMFSLYTMEHGGGRTHPTMSMLVIPYKNSALGTIEYEMMMHHQPFGDEPQAVLECL